MVTEADVAGSGSPPAGWIGAVIEDLRLRLQGSLAQETAARAEARRLARELAVAHRLLRALRGNPPPPRVPPPAPVRPLETAAAAPRQRATRLTDRVLFHLDSCEDRGPTVAVTGWAFRPAPEWDARATTVTLLFRDGATVYQAAASRMPRADIAVHFAAQSAGLSGGARGLDGAGFTCEILQESLPADVDLEIVLRLECAGLACEQPTGSRLRF